MTSIERLLKLQEYDCRARDLEREMKDVPARKKGEESRLTDSKQAVADGEQTLKAKQAELKKLELEVQARKEKISKLRQQQLELKTNREFRAMEDEVKVIEAEIAQVEDLQLTCMDDVEAARTDLEVHKGRLAENQSVVEKDIRVLDARMAQIRAELEELHGIRETSARDIPTALLERYRRIFERRDRALVPVEQGVCGGCHMKLPPYVVHNIRKQADSELVACEFCGRLLYLP